MCRTIDCDDRSWRYRVIVVPTHFGAPRPGTDQGPRWIVEQLDLARWRHVAGISVLEPPAGRAPEEDDRPSRRCRNVEAIVRVCDRLKQLVRDSLQRREIPLVLHGDDSSVIGTGYGVCAALEDSFATVYFDAHGDANTVATTPSGCLYGMAVAHLIGYGKPELLALNGYRPAIQPQNLHLVGTRNLDPGERDFIVRERLSIHGVTEVRRGAVATAESIFQRMEAQRIEQFYLHVDQDVVDPAESGATLCPEPGGLHVEELLEIVEYLKRHAVLVAVSIGNYYPALDREHKTLGVIRDLLLCLKT